ncbi:proopiomelanocortin b isoform X2 [Ictalurus furcatus]|uniref:proopiomelanocortin b isoform X2 n=1 Tax=Ictalurus furcatus TaxID=66913 RepID=UPI002350D598|nr:proopiomelanocortin b isoform X2 [Ictalurus furcatus]
MVFLRLNISHRHRMRCFSWLSAALVLCVCGSEVDGRCWDLADCNGLDSRDKIIECIWQCRLKQLVSNTESLLLNQQPSSEEDEEDEEDEEEEEEEEEDSLSLGILLSSLAPSDASREQPPSTRPQRSEERPPYAMEHFRWGKPMSRKRRPVKVHTAVSADDEGHEEPSTETSFPSLDRRQLENGEESEQKTNANAKSTTKYRITHFRWSAPPAAKRYGGFMKPGSERSHKPLLTLLRNIIARNGQ